MFGEQNQLNSQKFADLDNALFESVAKIDLLKSDIFNQEDIIKVNREGINEVMSQLDEIEMEISQNINKQLFIENQMEIVANKMPVKEFYGQNEALFWNDSKFSLVDEFCINKGETLEFFARLTIDALSEDGIGESELQLEVEGKGTVSFSREKISRVGDMTLYYKHTFDQDATVNVNFDPKISGPNRVTILPRAF